MQFTLDQAHQLVASFGGDTETEMDVTYGDGNRGVGFYVCPTDNEDEGAVFLADMDYEANTDATVEDIRQNLAGLHAATNEIAKTMAQFNESFQCLFTMDGQLEVRVNRG